MAMGIDKHRIDIKHWRESQESEVVGLMSLLPPSLFTPLSCHSHPFCPLFSSPPGAYRLCMHVWDGGPSRYRGRAGTMEAHSHCLSIINAGWHCIDTTAQHHVPPPSSHHCSKFTDKASRREEEWPRVAIALQPGLSLKWQADQLCKESQPFTPSLPRSKEPRVCKSYPYSSNSVLFRQIIFYLFIFFKLILLSTVFKTLWVVIGSGIDTPRKTKDAIQPVIGLWRLDSIVDIPGVEV